MKKKTSRQLEHKADSLLRGKSKKNHSKQGAYNYHPVQKRTKFFVVREVKEMYRVFFNMTRGE